MPVEAWVHGNTLHVAVATKLLKKIACLVGLNCSKADEVVVFDIQDRTKPLQVGEYDAEAHPWIFARSTRDMFVLPKDSGFEVYRVNPRK